MPTFLLISLFLFQQSVYTTGSNVVDTLIADDIKKHARLISGNEGLSQNLVYSTHRDRNGFLWFGTKDGLNRYDGYEFRVFRHNFFDTTTISNPYVVSISEDTEGYLWLSSFDHRYIDRFDPASGRSRRFLIELPDNIQGFEGAIFKIVPATDGWIFLNKSTNIVAFHPETGETRFITEHPWKRNNIHDIFWDGQQIWVAAGDDGLFSIHIPNFEIRQYPLSETNIHITALGKQNQTLWVGSDYSLIPFNTQKMEWGDPLPSVRHLTDWPHPKSVSYDGHEFIYVLYNRDLLAWSTIKQQWQEPYVKDIGISLLADENSIVWIGTNGYGIIKLDMKHQRFEAIPGKIFEVIYRKEYEHFMQQCDFPAYSLEYPVYGLAETGDTIWFAMGFYGIGSYNRKTRSAECREVVLDGTRHWINLLETTRDNRIIITAGNGYLLMDPLTRDMQLVEVFTDEWMRRYPDFTRDAFNITALNETPDGVIWIGTANAGLIRYNPVDQSVTRFDDRKEKYLQTSSPMILSFGNDPKSPERFLWIGTEGGGLNRLDMTDERFRYYTESEGLPNQIIYSVIPERDQFIWLSTNSGLVRFSPSTNQFINFTRRHRLLNNEFNRREYYSAPSGRLYFGGINGVDAFYFEQIMQRMYSPTIVFTEIKLFRESIYPDYMKMLRSGDIRPLSFRYDQNMFSFEFASLDYTIPEANQYRYRLTGFDNDWIEAGFDRSAVYTNLSPGSYTFEVSATNSDGAWSPKRAGMSFIISPPFWATTWFRILIFVLITGITTAVVWNISRRKYRRQMREMERVALVNSERLRISKDMHDELGAQLTQIRLMSELGRMKENPNGDSKVLLSEISESVGNTMNTLSSMVWSVDPGNDTLDNLAGYISRYTVEYLGKVGKSCRLQIDRDLPSLTIPSNMRHNLLLCVKEAVNNAVKYSGAQQVQLGMKLEGEELEITIIDSGKGFDLSKLNNHSNGLTNMSRRMEAIGGEAVIESIPGKGTVVKLRCKIKDETRKV